MAQIWDKSLMDRNRVQHLIMQPLMPAIGGDLYEKGLPLVRLE